MSPNAQYLRQLRAKASAEGKCYECRARPAADGKRNCEHCLEKHRERYRAYRAVGLCGCGREPDVGFENCPTCLQQNARDNAASYRRKKDAGTCVRPGCHAAADLGYTMCRPHCDAMAVAQRERTRRGASS